MTLLRKPVKLRCKDVHNNIKYNRKVVNTQYMFNSRYCLNKACYIYLIECYIHKICLRRIINAENVYDILFYFILINLFLLLFKYSCLHFPPTMPTHHTHPHHPPSNLFPLALSMCPLYMFLDGTSLIYSH